MNAAIVQRATHCLVPAGEDRISAFRWRLQSSPGYSRIAHDARIAQGVVWLREWHRRPVPRHRALTVSNTERGGNPAEDYALAECASGAPEPITSYADIRGG